MHLQRLYAVGWAAGKAFALWIISQKNDQKFTLGDLA